MGSITADLIINAGIIKVKDSNSIEMRDLSRDLTEAMEDFNFNGRD